MISRPAQAGFKTHPVAAAARELLGGVGLVVAGGTPPAVAV